MTDRSQLAALRRQQLVARCTAERTDLAMQLQAFNPLLQSVDSSVRIVKKIRRHPGWIAAAAIGLALLSPRRLASWMRLGSVGLRTWRTIAPQVQGLLSHYR